MIRENSDDELYRPMEEDGNDRKQPRTQGPPQKTQRGHRQPNAVEEMMYRRNRRPRGNLQDGDQRERRPYVTMVPPETLREQPIQQHEQGTVQHLKYLGSSMPRRNLEGQMNRGHTLRPIYTLRGSDGQYYALKNDHRYQRTYRPNVEQNAHETAESTLHNPAIISQIANKVVEKIEERQNRVRHTQQFTSNNKSLEVATSAAGITNANVHQQKVRTARAHVPQKFDKSNKKGYLLVINYMFPGDEDKKRIASDYDVGSLCKFFTKINYDIDCRTDMTTTELKQCLERVRNDMLTRDSSKYHCFICVIMSHGGERGISTKDGYMELDYIVNFFRNERVKKFVGKPKIFIFQSCRGSDIQQKQEQIKSSIVLGDSSSPVQKLPNHADILRIYATTPGHVAYRKSGSSRWNGSWLINAFLQAASGMYLKHHIEDIMTVVRHQLSTNPEYENDGEKCQIAVSENTLTKHFFL